jgi:ankyrin repeat protein
VLPGLSTRAEEKPAAAAPKAPEEKPVGSLLSFYILPNQFTLMAERFDVYKLQLLEDGPPSDVDPQSELNWLPAKASSPKVEYEATYQGKRYMLVYHKRTLLPPALDRHARWELTSAYTSRREDGSLVIGLDLDPYEGRRRLRNFTKRYVGHQLAAAIDGTVFSAVKITAPIKTPVLMPGSFSEREANRLIARLSVGMPPVHSLYRAVNNRELDLVRRILDFNPALVNARHDGKPSDHARGYTPLIYAVRHGAAEPLMKLLLERGADVSVRDASGATALHGAAHNGRVKAAQLLIDHGADVSARREPPAEGKTRWAESMRGMTPLHETAIYEGNSQPPIGYKKVAELLRQPLFIRC